MSAEFIQTLVVSSIALGAAAILVWRVVSVSFAKPTTTAPCARCATGEKCNPTQPPTQPQDQLIRIQTRSTSAKPAPARDY